MKKKFMMILVMFMLLLLPGIVNAEIINLDNYTSTNLVDALASEDIEQEFTGYEENDKQVTIYLFRGLGCPHCKEFLQFLNSITAEYGDKFKLKSFEVWYDSNNSDLLDMMKDVTGKEASGVPYILIGDKIFRGYSEDWNEDIINTIETEYKKKDKFDYFVEYNKSQKKTLKDVDGSLTMIVVIVADALSVIIIVYVQNKNKKEIIRYINKSLKKSKIEEIISEVEEMVDENNEEDDLEEKEKTKKKKKKK